MAFLRWFFALCLLFGAAGLLGIAAELTTTWLKRHV